MALDPVEFAHFCSRAVAAEIHTLTINFNCSASALFVCQTHTVFQLLLTGLVTSQKPTPRSQSHRSLQSHRMRCCWPGKPGLVDLCEVPTRLRQEGFRINSGQPYHSCTEYCITCMVVAHHSSLLERNFKFDPFALAHNSKMKPMRSFSLVLCRKNCS